MQATEFRYCRALYQVAVSVNSSLDPRKLLLEIPESAAKALRAKACSLMLLSPDRKELRHRASYGLSEWYTRKGPIEVDLSIAEALSGHSVAVADVATDQRVQYRAEAVREGIASILCVPIRLRGEVIGVMRAYSADRREFDAEEIEFVEAVASLGAIALDNANRYDEMRSDFDAVCNYAYGTTLIGRR